MDKRLQSIDPFITRMEAKRQAEWSARLARKPEVKPTTAAAERPSLFNRAAGWWTTFRNIVLNALGAVIFIGACLLLYDAVMRPTVAIAPISMPNALETKGYSGEVAAHRLSAALAEIVEQAHSQKSGAEVAGLGEIPDIIVPNTGLSVETIAAQIRKLFGWGSRWYVSGDAIADGDQQYELRLKIMNDRQPHLGSAPVKTRDINVLFDAGARQILESADPYLLAASYSDIDPSKSMKLAQRLAENDPNGVSGGFWAHVLIGRLLIDSKDFDRAITESEKAISFGRNSAALDTACTFISRALFNCWTDAKFAAPHNNIGLALQSQRKLEEAVSEYKKAIAIDQKFALPHNNLGNALRDQGQLEEAVAEYKKAIEIDQKFAVPHVNLGNALHDQSHIEEAVAEYKKAIEIDPKYAWAHVNLGNALRDQGQLEEAVAEYKKAIELDPKYAWPHNNLGNALRDRGQLEEAVAEYKKAIELDPKYAWPHNNLGSAWKMQNKLDEAITEYKKAIELDLKFALAHKNLGDAFKMQNKLDEAIAEYKKASELDPNNSWFRADLQSALEAQSLAPAEAKPDGSAPKTKGRSSRPKRRAGTLRR